MPKQVEPPDIEEKSVGSLYSKVDILKVVGEYISDSLVAIDYEEDHFWTNIRMFLCALSCAFGAYGQLGTKFPDDKHAISLCVVGYFLTSAIVAVVDFLVVKTSVLCVRVGSESVFVDLDMPSFSEQLTITLRSRTNQVSMTKSVADYFDTDHILRAEHVFRDIMSLMKKYEAKDGKKDKNL
eukprot:TRINITY_DN128_c0_g2_i1.p1 TRINITY_DN128_c0_g2~~TRINITY_DN128_c0_g2_i1.p1  ORF type:complete len:182 (-),score=32.60 TRINITY_DN128_c0_g2_i1:205-750(-)